MEYKKIRSKRENCFAYYIADENQLYLAKNGLENLSCYFSSCKATGEIIDEKFTTLNHRHTHKESAESQFHYLNFWNELKAEVKKGLQANKIIFDAIYLK
jgi:hypothetical protein